MHKLSSRQWLVLVLLTIVWGINWPIMKAGVTGFPPLTFRMLCLLLGTPVLGLALLAMRVPFRIPREHWRELLVLAVFNMFIWHGLIIIAVQSLSSGRSAILGYTMPIFSAVLGALFFGDRLASRAWAGVGAAAVGVMLLLWHEFTHLSGRPLGVLLALIAASTWALGTQLLRRTKMPVPTLAISFWMTPMTLSWLRSTPRVRSSETAQRRAARYAPAGASRTTGSTHARVIASRSSSGSSAGRGARTGSAPSPRGPRSTTRSASRSAR